MPLFGPGAEIFDVTLPISSDLPVWPGHPDVSVRPLARIARGDAANLSFLRCSSHTGTHVDALWHFEDSRARLLEIPIERWIGPCRVIAMPEAVGRIEPEHLDAANIPAGTERLIIRTANSRLWQEPGKLTFDKTYVHLSPAGAEWVVTREIRLIGVDYLSVEKYGEPEHATHHTLLGNDVLIIEGLNLNGIQPGPYELVCLPLPLAAGDGAPARVLLVRHG